MGVVALVMAGGKGSRLSLSVEKPLLKVGGKPVIVYVLEALKSAKKVDSVVVAVSGFTPKTAQLMDWLGVRVVMTPGKDYVSDMGFAVKELGLGVFLAVAADLPLVSGDVLDAVLERYEHCGKPALTVAVPLELKQKLGMCVEYAFDLDGKHVVPAGINVIDGRKQYGDEWLDQDIFLLDLAEVAVNINTVDELRLAESLLAEHAKE